MCSWWLHCYLTLELIINLLGKCPRKNPFDSSCCAITVLWNTPKAATESYQSLPSTSLESLSIITLGVLGLGCAALMGFPRDSVSLISSYLCQWRAPSGTCGCNSGAPTLQSVCRQFGWLAPPRGALRVTPICQHISLKDIRCGPHHPSPTAGMIPCMACCFGGVLCSKPRGIYAFLSIQDAKYF